MTVRRLIAVAAVVLMALGSGACG
ncbi:MAG: hypothetical protein QOI90_1631, partial [Mycobacterium sp.]|nr:hypothetical protein [Mycobacterium sp.]